MGKAARCGAVAWLVTQEAVTSPRPAEMRSGSWERPAGAQDKRWWLARGGGMKESKL